MATPLREFLEGMAIIDTIDGLSSFHSLLQVDISLS